MGGFQRHLAAEALGERDNQASKCHLCYRVRDLAAAERHFRCHGVTILPDENPIADWPRFYLQDPGGNRIEVAAVLSP